MTFAFSGRIWAAAAVGLTLATVAPAAHADPESDAKDLFAKGRDLREKNDCGTAAPLFRKAWTIYPNGLGSLRNLAECEEQLGHFASSRRAWLDLKRSLITNTDPKYNDWEKDADDAAKRLQPKVASFVVDVIVRTPQGEAPATEKSGIDLFVNGEEVKGTLVGTPLERDPGNYLIRAQAKDAQPVEQNVSLSAGDNPHVTLRITVTPPEQPAAVVEDHSTRRTVGWAVTGLGAALVVASGVTFLMRQGALGDVDDTCGGDHEKCSPSAKGRIDDAVDRGKTMSTLTTILLPAGLVGIGAGLVLVFTSPKAEKTGAIRSFQLAPTLGGLSLGGKF